MCSRSVWSNASAERSCGSCASVALWLAVFILEGPRINSEKRAQHMRPVICPLEDVVDGEIRAHITNQREGTEKIA